MSNAEDNNTGAEEKVYRYCGHTLKITMFKGSSLGLSAYVWGPDKKLDFKGKKVLELGSGTGIVGILAALLGGHVTITDVTEVLKQIQYNVNANIPDASKHHPKVCALHWGTDQDDFPSDYDFILGSDIVYSPSLFPGLIQTLVHCSNENTTIYLSTNMPARMGTETFHRELVTRKFNSELVHTNGMICIYKVTKKHAR